MADLLEQASAWLAGQRRQHLSQQVTYCRGEASVTLAATAGTSTVDATDATGAVVVWQSQDWIIAAADLVLDGEPVLPQAGDRIGHEVNGQVRVYEVMAPPGQDVYRQCDPLGTSLRVHTKRISTE